jgi:predicted DNA-binding protein (MmcQ/YjbR family)
MTLKAPANRHEAQLRKFALSFPETVEEFPWGHRAIKVRSKTFVFLAGDSSGLSLSVKLPSSRGVALTLPFAQPTGYGLGKSGWVTASFPKGKKPPLDLLEEWIEESYRAIAPKRLVSSLER